MRIFLFQANQEVRKQIRKQHSLPDSGEPKRYRTLRESFMLAVKKAPNFENFKNSFSLFRVPEEDPATPAEKSPPIVDLGDVDKVGLVQKPMLQVLDWSEP